MFYRHFKGKFYQVVSKGLDTVTEQPVVVYRTLYPSEYPLYTRPAEEFHGYKHFEDGTQVQRFEAVEFDTLPHEAAALVIDGFSCSY